MKHWVSRTGPWLLVLLAVAVAGAFGGYLTEQDGGRVTSTVELLEADGTPLRGTIRSLTTEEVTIRVGALDRTFALQAETLVEGVEPIGVADINVGDWLNAGAIPQDQAILTIIGLVVIPNELVQE